MCRRPGGHLGGHAAAQPKEWDQLLSALAALYVHGVRIDWLAFDHDYPADASPSLPILSSVNDSGLTRNPEILRVRVAIRTLDVQCGTRIAAG